MRGGVCGSGGGCRALSLTVGEARDPSSVFCCCKCCGLVLGVGRGGSEMEVGVA